MTIEQEREHVREQDPSVREPGGTLEWSEQAAKDRLRMWMVRIGPAWPKGRGTDAVEAAWVQTDKALRVAWTARSLALVERAMSDFAAVCEREYER